MLTHAIPLIPSADHIRASSPGVAAGNSSLGANKGRTNIVFMFEHWFHFTDASETLFKVAWSCVNQFQRPSHHRFQAMAFDCREIRNIRSALAHDDNVRSAFQRHADGSDCR